MKRGVAVLIVLALVACGVIALAQRGNPPTRPMPPRMAPPPARGEMGPAMFERIKKELNLTPDQVKQMEAIHKDFMDTTKATRDDIKAKMAQMLDLWTADQPDAAAIKDLASQMETERAQIRDTAIDHLISAMAILTPDQRTKIRNWIKNNPHLGMGMGCGICCAAGLGCGGGCGMGQGAGMGQGPATWKK